MHSEKRLKYEVFSFEYFLDCFAQKLATVSDTELAEVRFKRLFSFLVKYAKKIQPKTVIVENEYIDRDFLEDYVAYHARSFHDYGKRCTRILLFSSKFSLEDLNSMLAQDGNSKEGFLRDFISSYLGYIVVRPLPRKMIGRTALKTYPAQSISDPSCIRYYRGTFPCKSNLFGIPLSVDSLPFQEQDRSVSACATSALWSVLHKIADLFECPVFSPSEVTKLAMQGTSFTERIFPNNGLTVDQISNAIRMMGLETKYIGLSRFKSPEDVLEFKESVYSYLMAGIPMVFGFDLYSQPKASASNCWKYEGRHAVALAGYGLSSRHHSYADNTIHVTAHRLQKLYVHDDQTGPFSKIEFEGIIKVQRKERIEDVLSLTTEWNNDEYNYRAVPALLLVPLYHKIRIDYSKIKQFACGIDSCVRNSRKPYNTELIHFWNANVSWNITLSCLNDYKSTILSDNDISSEERIRLLTSSLPRFFWCCSLEQNGSKAIDFLFDATDISSGDLFVHLVEYQRGFCRGVLNLLSSQQALIPENSFLRRLLRLILQSYEERV
jgi:hypothetical protein